MDHTFETGPEKSLPSKKALAAGAIAIGASLAAGHELLKSGVFNEAADYRVLERGDNPTSKMEARKPSKYEGKTIVNNGMVNLFDGTQLRVSGSYIDPETEEVKPQYYAIKPTSEEGNIHVIAYEKPDTSGRPIPVQLNPTSLGVPVWGAPYGYGTEEVGRQKIGDDQLGSYFEIVVKNKDGELESRYISASSVVVTSDRPVVKAEELE